MRAAAILVAWLLGASVAAAQTPVPSQSGTQGAIQVERIYSRFVVGPDYRVTRIDGQTGQLAGVTAGWLREELLYVGGAVYWLAGGASAWDMHYGGLVIGMQIPSERRITFGARALTGVGTATNSTTLSALVGVRDGFLTSVPTHRGWRINSPMPFVDGNARVDVSDTFLVFEPEATMTWRVTNRIRFGLSAGYRFTGNPDRYAFDDRLNGATGAVTVQFGIGGS
jgi:hypothetical protein